MERNDFQDMILVKHLLAGWEFSNLKPIAATSYT
jgi:hypothetical protein